MTHATAWISSVNSAAASMKPDQASVTGCWLVSRVICLLPVASVHLVARDYSHRLPGSSGPLWSWHGDGHVVRIGLDVARLADQLERRARDDTRLVAARRPRDRLERPHGDVKRVVHYPSSFRFMKA